MAIKAFLTPKINFRNFNPSIMISSMFILKKKIETGIHKTWVLLVIVFF